jgi:ribosome recycling factor
MADKMDKAIDVLEAQIFGINRAGVTPAFVDSFKVEYYGQNVQLKELGFSTQKNGHVIVKIYDIDMVQPVLKVLVNAGLNAYILYKDTISVSVPSMSGEEKTRTIVRLNKLGEEAKISVRNIRRTYRTKENDKKVQEITDKAISIICGLIDRKIMAL